MRLIVGIIIGATIGAIARRLIGLAVAAGALALITGSVSHIGPIRTHGNDIAERVQNLRITGVDTGDLTSDVADVFAKGGGDDATIVRAVDGDTLVVRVGGKSERVRLLGIDTPETVKPNTPVQPCGLQASTNAKSWVKSHHAVTLRRDGAAPNRDRYGRLLRYVEPNGKNPDLSTVQIVAGYSRVEPYGQRLSKLSTFRAAERTARRHHRGLWGPCR